MGRLRSKTGAKARVSDDHDEKYDAETHENEIGHNRLLLFFLDRNMAEARQRSMRKTGVAHKEFIIAAAPRPPGDGKSLTKRQARIAFGATLCN